MIGRGLMKVYSKQVLPYLQQKSGSIDINIKGNRTSQASYNKFYLFAFLSQCLEKAKALSQVLGHNVSNSISTRQVISSKFISQVTNRNKIKFQSNLVSLKIPLKNKKENGIWSAKSFVPFCHENSPETARLNFKEFN
jgi:hypothetical protein